MTESCAFCGDDRVTHQHHIVPRRYGGSDEKSNLLPLCPTCHAIVERTWDETFYDVLGVEKESADEFEIEERTLVNACKMINSLVDLDDIFLELDLQYGRNLRRAVFETKRQSKEAILSLAQNHELCNGCEMPTDEQPCVHCGAKNAEIENRIEI